ncbi:MAG: hypothetical protein HFH19_00700 [Ruminococcus sp.]|nr:hypothetical protein [Ruminococcus sp.]
MLVRNSTVYKNKKVKEKNIMFKKQILKLKHGKRLIGTGLLGLMLMGSITAFAGNTKDRYYSATVGASGYSTPVRSKLDYTSSYILHEGDRAVYAGVYSGGVNYSANGSSYYVAVGTSSYLPNYVRENGKSSCCLRLTPAPAGSCYLHGWWSPDSI